MGEEDLLGGIYLELLTAKRKKVEVARSRASTPDVHKQGANEWENCYARPAGFIIS